MSDLLDRIRNCLDNDLAIPKEDFVDYVEFLDFQSKKKNKKKDEFTLELMKVVEFYASVRSWSKYHMGDYVSRILNHDDIELNVFGSDEHCGGKRARAAQQLPMWKKLRANECLY